MNTRGEILILPFIIADNAGRVTVVPPTPVNARDDQKPQYFPRIALNGADARRGARRGAARLTPYVVRVAVVLLAAGVGAAAGPTTTARTIAHPDDPARQVEFFVETPRTPAPWPTVVLLHGHQEGPRPGGREFADWGVLRRLAARGYLAVSISQPGYGATSGPADFAGPATQHAIEGVIARLRAEHLARPKKIVLEGISLGALSAGLTALHDADIAGVVLISGVYDLPAYVAEARGSPAKAAVVVDLLHESGGSATALAERSLLPQAAQLKAEALILNGAKDERSDPQQARTLAARIVRTGGRAQAIIYPDSGHYIPVEVRARVIDPFIDRLLRDPGA
jgi:pimeloyl-ACP methyl ester carboxylesterase